MTGLRSLLVGAVALLSVSVSAAPAAGSKIVARAPLPPSVDPFYQPPAGFEDAEPGTILRQRKIVASYFGLIPDTTQAWQLLYRTNSINGSAIADVTTVFKPLVSKKDKFVAFNTAYDGAAQSGICDPSYNYQLGAPQFDLISSVEYFLLQAYIKSGYICSVSDYEGPDSAFGAGRLSGTGVLDSMRAVGNFKATLGFSTKTPAVVGYGYSGGGIATGWAASLKANYAPELNVKGWASGGTPANLTGTAEFLDGTTFAGFVPQALVGLSTPSAYGAELQPVFDRYLTAEGRADVAAAEQICGVENLFIFAFQEIQSTEFNTLGDRILYEPTVARVLERCTMGVNRTETPKAPVYLFHATNDEIIPYNDATILQNRWCSYGADVQFVTYANGGHATTEALGFPGAYQFVEQAFAGTVQKGCSMTTKLDDTLNPIALGASLEPILIQLLNALAIAGRKDANIIKDPTQLEKTIPDA